MTTLIDIINILKRKGIFTKIFDLSLVAILYLYLSMFKSSPLVDTICNIVCLVLVLLIIILPVGKKE